MAWLMSLPLTVSCSSKSRLVYLPGFTFVVLAHPGSHGQNPESHKMIVLLVLAEVKLTNQWSDEIMSSRSGKSSIILVDFN